MPKNLHNGSSHVGMAKDSAIPTVTIKVPMPSNVKAPAKETPKSTSR
jgi:hypothetical protein